MVKISSSSSFWSLSAFSFCLPVLVETIEGILHVVIDDNDIGATPETENQHLIASLQQQIEHLQQTCDKIVTKNLNVSKNFTN